MISFLSRNWCLKNVRGVLFDKDGTLIDSHVYWGRIIERRAGAIIRHYGVPESWFGELCLAMGYGVQSGKLIEEGPIALVSREEVIAVLLGFLALRGINATEAELSDLFVKEHERFLEESYNYIHILPGVRELLTQLQSLGIKAAVVTTDTVRNTEEILQFLGLDIYFDGVIGKESTREPKITGVPATAALRILNLPANSTVAIGDAPMDLIMAQKSGLKGGIGIASGQIPLGALLEYSPFIAANMGELKIRLTQEHNSEY